MKLCLEIPITGNASVQIRGDRANQDFALCNSHELAEFTWNDLNFDAVCICINLIFTKQKQMVATAKVIHQESQALNVHNAKEEHATKKEAGFSLSPGPP